jgi:hypothetical protein
MIDPVLQKRFDFNESDLNANRAGRLSQRQVDKRVTAFKKAKPFRIGCGLGLMLIATIFPIVFGPMMWEMRDSWGVLLGLGCGVSVWALTWGAFGVGFIAGAFKPPSFQLASVSGPVNLVGVTRTTGGENPTTYTAYELRVGKSKFDVDSALGNEIMQGDTYAIYHIEGTEEIMSLERL